MAVTFKGEALIASKYVEAADLKGQRVPVVIEKIIKSVDLQGQNGKKEKKPAFQLRGKAKLWILNKTNLNLIAQVYGSKADSWPGKTVVIYGADVEVGGQMKQGIRVDVEATRDFIESGAKAPEPEAEPEHNPETGEVADSAEVQQ